MKELCKLTKQELISLCRKLQAENEDLQFEMDNLSDSYTELENELVDRINTLDCIDSIKNVKWFLWKLDLEGLLTPQLESFIENYLKFHNIVEG